MIYVVKMGDTLYSISEQTQIPVWKIAFDNQLSGQPNLVVGQALLLLDVDESGSIRDNLYVTGYAYPFIESAVLDQTFLALNELLVFSYGFTFTGELVPPYQDELWMIEAAWENGINPMLVLTPFANGTFNNQLVKVLVENIEIQQTLIANLLAAVQEKGYAGVDIDFEYILPENRVGYAEFVGSVRETMNANGYKVSVALAPKTSAGQEGLLYEGMDYALLGANADNVFLMTYEWGYTYSEPMAVAPINMVRQVVEYALTEIPAEKIIMGVPNYGYDWPLPYEKGITRARLIGNVEAVQIAAENGAEIEFEDISQTPHFTYTRDRISHEVWFEDVRSIEAKINLAKEHNLWGVGYWNLMRPFRANWMLLEKTN
ncbi:glycosyl hydrolase family 18 protein [Clostridium sp. C105KSO13]|uniref:glycosyl hydrolase family 18 protein n=1 Tax=Clostridium sp. C105KSO13 TaxID=1776045 RepID=UPI0007407868|nr:glycosyl hydrolase family 18 protein [Clostridium sp. C105KSO13]CUX42769.1 Spore germination protein YaaH [Clostridium sp. C105KSO13]